MRFILVFICFFLSVCDNDNRTDYCKRDHSADSIAPSGEYEFGSVSDILALFIFRYFNKSTVVVLTVCRYLVKQLKISFNYLLRGCIGKFGKLFSESNNFICFFGKLSACKVGKDRVYFRCKGI